MKVEEKRGSVPGYVSTKQAAEMLGITTGRVRQKAIAGDLDKIRLGRDVYVSVESIEAVVKSRK